MSLAKRVMERKLAGKTFDFGAAAAAAAEAPAAQTSDSETHTVDGSAEEAAPAAAARDPLASAGGSIARRHREKILAQTRTARAALGVDLNEIAANDDAIDPAELAYAQIRQQLDEDRRRLKAIQSTESKVELKRQLVLNYDAHVAGVLSAATAGAKGVQDEVFVTAMIWRIDIGDYIGALPLIEHVLRFGLDMPGHFKSTAPVFIVETIAEDAIRTYYAGGDAAKAFPAGVLPQIEDLTVDEDMHDQVRAKLQKAIGMAVMAGADLDDGEDTKLRQAETLRRYMRALQLDPKAGVKKQIEQLNRDLAKPTVPGRLDQVAATIADTAVALQTVLTDAATAAAGADAAATANAAAPDAAAPSTEPSPAAPEG